MIQAKKTNAPRIGVATGRKNGISADRSWYISVRYYVTNGQKGIDRKIYGYATKKDAVSDSALYRHHLESTSRSQRAKWDPSTFRMNKKLPNYSSAECSNSIGVLSATEMKVYKCTSRGEKLEKEFDVACERSPVLRSKFKNLFNRSWYSERDARQMKRALAINARRFRCKLYGKRKKTKYPREQEILKRKELLMGRIKSRSAILKDLQISYTFIREQRG